jgi:hypothetical protein
MTAVSDKRRKRPGYDADGEMTGQIALFTVDGCEWETQVELADEGSCLANEDCWCQLDHRCQDERGDPS